MVVAVIDTGFDLPHPDRPLNLRTDCDYVVWRHASFAGPCPAVSGGPVPTQTERDAVQYALQRGVVVVAAAGNEYQEGNPASYPAAYPGVVAEGYDAGVEARFDDFALTGGNAGALGAASDAGAPADSVSSGLERVHCTTDVDRSLARPAAPTPVRSAR